MAGSGLAGDDSCVVAGGDGEMPVRRQDQVKDGAQGGNAVLEIPGVLLHVGPHGALVLVGDDGSRVCGWRTGDLRVKVHIQHAVLVIAYLDDLFVGERVGMAIRGDAPDVQRVQLAVTIDGDHDGGETAALGSKDLDDAAFQQDGFAVGLDGEGLFVIEHDCFGGFGVIRSGGVRRGEHPVGRLRRAGMGRRSRDREDERCNRQARGDTRQ